MNIETLTIISASALSFCLGFIWGMIIAKNIAIKVLRNIEQANIQR
jgi:VIT1/CCC1 family predicted Fe2+/Mn2+ transporter